MNHPSRFRLYPWSVDAVRAINRAGWLAVLVTNQAGVARGYFPEKVVHLVLGQDAGRDGRRVERTSTPCTSACITPRVGEPPYRKDCDCRKPRPGMLKRRAETELGRRPLPLVGGGGPAG